MQGLRRRTLRAVCRPELMRTPAGVRQAKSFAAVEPRSLSIRLRLTTPSQPARRPEPSSNPIDRPGYRTPPRPASSRVNTFVAGRDSAPESTGFHCADLLSNRQRTYGSAQQLPTPTNSYDRATGSYAPVAADILPLCLRPATTQSMTPAETQAIWKYRAHELPVPPGHFKHLSNDSPCRQSAHNNQDIP